MIFHNKKGNVVFVVALLIVVLAVFAIISMLGYNIFSEIKPDIVADLTSNESITVMNDVDTRLPSWVDGAIMIILIGFWMIGIASVMTKDEHPIVYGLMMFLLLFVVIAGAMIGNSYEELMQDSSFVSLPAQFPVTNFILTHMLELTIVVAISILLVHLAKNRS